MGQRLRTARLLCDFDSSVATVRAVSRFLHGRDFGALGVLPGSAWLSGLVSHLPARARWPAFVLGGTLQSSPVSRMQGFRGEDLAAWMTQQYGPGPYPAAFIGSGSGAAVHLAAALGAPVLPQTFLAPVRARLDPDQPLAALEAGRELGRRLVDANPDLSLCHMHDPSQDRAMLVRFMYFRFKRLRLGAVLERFLEQRLAPGGTIFIVDCTLKWPMSLLGDRQRFQFGALGGMPAEEYGQGSDRVARHLAEQGAPVRRWRAPSADEAHAEAEWGYDDRLTPDITALAARCGYRVRRITIAEPEHLSPLAAELYRWWHRGRGLPAQRMLVETYNQLEPYWAQRLGAVPFWLQFTTRPSYLWLERYLSHSEPYERIGVNLFSNGLRSVGQVSAEEWHEIAQRFAGREGGTIGVDEGAYPKDIASTLRYRPALAALPERHPMPPPLSLGDFDTFLSQARDTPALQPVRIEALDTGA